MTKFEEEVKETYEKVSINLYGNNAGSVGMKKLLNELKDTGLLKEQQSLPVVPECVGEWIECVKKDGLLNALGLLDNDNMPKDVDEWLFLQSTDDNINLILRAWLDGYTVEKPQVFYLKNTLTHEYLYRKYKTSLGEQSYCKGTDGKPLDYCLFTLDEIESMNTGSYEQIEVAE